MDDHNLFRTHIQHERQQLRLGDKNAGLAQEAWNEVALNEPDQSLSRLQMPEESKEEMDRYS